MTRNDRKFDLQKQTGLNIQTDIFLISGKIGVEKNKSKNLLNEVSACNLKLCNVTCFTVIRLGTLNRIRKVKIQWTNYSIQFYIKQYIQCRHHIAIQTLLTISKFSVINLLITQEKRRKISFFKLTLSGLFPSKTFWVNVVLCILWSPLCILCFFDFDVLKFTDLRNKGS